MNVTEMAVASENLNALVGQMQVRAARMHRCCQPLWVGSRPYQILHSGVGNRARWLDQVLLLAAPLVLQLLLMSPWSTQTWCRGGYKHTHVVV